MGTERSRRASGEGGGASFLSVLVRFSPARTALALVLMVLLGLAEGAGLLLLVPILEGVGLRMGESGLGGAGERLLGALGALGIPRTLLAGIAAYVAAASLAALLGRWQTLANLRLQHELTAHLRRRLYGAISGTSWTFFSRSRASDFTQLLTADVERAGAAAHHLLQVLVASIIAAVYAGFAVRISPAMTGIVLGCGVALMLLSGRKARRAREEGEGLSLALGDLHAAVAEHLGGMKTVKSHGAEGRHVELFDRLTREIQERFTGAVRSQADLKCGFEIGSVLLLGAAAYIAVEVVRLPAAELFFLIYLFARILPRISTVLQGYQSVLNLLPSFAAVRDMEGRCRAAAEPEAPAREEADLRREIRLDGVTFRYGEAPAVRGLDLAIPAGATAAIAGPSGAGKSTLADLLIGLLAPGEGRVLIDGKPLGPERRASWREKVGYVGQDTFLFHDTIRANLLWARPGAAEEDLRDALEAAGARQFIARLPKGLETVVGDRGVLLSGGERQRIALARALLRKPSLLVLDEATSHLDPEGEAEVQHAVRGLRGGRTIVLITHRLSSLLGWGADEVHVLEGGRLVESGRPEDLLEDPGSRLISLSGRGVPTAARSDA